MIQMIMMIRKKRTPEMKQKDCGDDKNIGSNDGTNDNNSNNKGSN